MKKVEKYRCDYCNTEYKIKADCTECEANHKHSIEITAEKFLPFGMDKSGYPLTVSVKMSDGRTITYKRG